MEILPSSTDGLGHNVLKNHPNPGDYPLILLHIEKRLEGMMLQRSTLGREVFELPAMELRMETNTEVDTDGIWDGTLRCPQYTI